MKKLSLVGMALAMMLAVSPAMAAEADKASVAKDSQFSALSLVPATQLTDKELNAIEGKGFSLTFKVNIAKLRQRNSGYHTYKTRQRNSALIVQVIH